MFCAMATRLFREFKMDKTHFEDDHISSCSLTTVTIENAWSEMFEEPRMTYDMGIENILGHRIPNQWRNNSLDMPTILKFTIKYYIRY